MRFQRAGSRLEFVSIEIAKKRSPFFFYNSIKLPEIVSRESFSIKKNTSSYNCLPFQLTRKMERKEEYMISLIEINFFRI